MSSSNVQSHQDWKKKDHQSFQDYNKYEHVNTQSSANGERKKRSQFIQKIKELVQDFQIKIKSSSKDQDQIQSTTSMSSDETPKSTS